MKVLVTGATGFIGSWVVRELLQHGHEVRVLLRTSSKQDNLEALVKEGEGEGAGGAASAGRAPWTFERAIGDVRDGEAVRRALDGCQAVIHTAGIPHFRPGHEQEMYDINVGGVETVMAAARAVGVERALVTSSAGAIGGALEPRIADEQTPSNAEALGIDYLISKYRGEQAALTMHQMGVPVIVLRPSYILGPGDIYESSASTFLAMARGKLPVLVDGGSSFTDVRDVARAHVTALTKGRVGEIYILGGTNLRVSEVAELAARLTGVPAPKRMPYPIAIAAATVIELGARAVGRSSAMSRQLAKAARLFTYVSSKKAEAELDYHFRGVEESLRDTFRFFLRAGRLKPTTSELRTLAERP